MKPVIGITANYMYDGSGEYREGIGAPDQEWQLLADDYITSVQRAGGIPVIFPVIREDVEWEVVKRLMDGVDGLLFSGGSDVDPVSYTHLPADPADRGGPRAGDEGAFRRRVQPLRFL